MATNKKKPTLQTYKRNKTSNFEIKVKTYIIKIRCNLFIFLNILTENDIHSKALHYFGLSFLFWLLNFD